MSGGVQYPENELTRLIERAHQHNMSGAAGMGVAGVSNADPRPTVSSAALGREVPAEEELSAEQRAELDAKAIELGIMTPSGETGSDNYGTLEEALATATNGIPVEDPVVALEKTLVPAPYGRRSVKLPVARVVEIPRFPDFKEVQGIDLKAGTVFIDTMEFQIPVNDLLEFKRYAVEIARQEIMKKLEEATGLFASEVSGDEEGSASGGSSVQRQSEGDRTKS